MFKIGEVKRAKEIGYMGHCKYIWIACVSCGKKRWVPLFKGKPVSLKCRNCALKNGNSFNFGKKGKNSISWKGGRIRDIRGYIRVWMESNNPFIEMKNQGGYIEEHRLVMAEYLNRCLKSWEVVHHINEVRDDNRIENLQLMTRSEHTRFHLRGRKEANYGI